MESLKKNFKWVAEKTGEISSEVGSGASKGWSTYALLVDVVVMMLKGASNLWPCDM